MGRISLFLCASLISAPSFSDEPAPTPQSEPVAMAVCSADEETTLTRHALTVCIPETKYRDDCAKALSEQGYAADIERATFGQDDAGTIYLEGKLAVSPATSFSCKFAPDEKLTVTFTQDR